jgi:hypothetical protein
VICNQLGESSQSADEKSQVQFASNFLRCKLTSAALGGTGEAGFALNWLTDTIHTQSYNNLRFPLRGSHIQLVRSARRSLLS